MESLYVSSQSHFRHFLTLDLVFWSWFPLGKAGIRAGLLFICGFSIFILRVAQLHIGIRTTNSPISTLKEYWLNYQNVQTVLWYTFSAWLYAEIFIFSANREANIKWITDARNSERPRLNERPIYLMAFFIFLGLVQSGIHIYYDYDRIDLPITNPVKPVEGDKPADEATKPEIVQSQVLAAIPNLLATSFKRSLLMTIITPLIYSTFIRQPAWSWTLSFAKMFWNLPKSTALPHTSPYHWLILNRSLWGGALLVLIWEVSNLAFSAFVAQPPLKKDMPITKDSKDENGSLLTGLNGKKLATRAFAFWELRLIADFFEARRIRIFKDIDRLPSGSGSAWAQILGACTKTIEDMNTRILARDAMAAPTEAVPTKKDYTPQLVSILKADEAAPQPVEPALPRLLRPIPTENVWTNPPAPKTTTEKIGRATHGLADKYGRAPQTAELPKKLLESAKTAVLTKEQEAQLTPEGVWAAAYPLLQKLLTSPLGFIFAQTFRRRTARVVLGAPFGDLSTIINSIHSLATFSVKSLKEDEYGHVSQSIPGIINLFTRSITNLEELRSGLGGHWSDIGERSSPELDAVLDAAREGLKSVVQAFEPYFLDMKIGRGEVAKAKEAMVRKEVWSEVEMKERKKSR